MHRGLYSVEAQDLCVNSDACLRLEPGHEVASRAGTEINHFSVVACLRERYHSHASRHPAARGNDCNSIGSRNMFQLSVRYCTQRPFSFKTRRAAQR